MLRTSQTHNPQAIADEVDQQTFANPRSLRWEKGDHDVQPFILLMGLQSRKLLHLGVFVQSSMGHHVLGPACGSLQPCSV